MSTSTHLSSRKGRKRRVSRRAHPGRIVGQGEMADLVRQFDWSKTAVGPIETWSDTLVTTVNLLLASSHSMFLWWGPDLIQFYNDSYRTSIRADKHPSALGQRGVECWPEIWPIIGPQIQAVMDEGRSTWSTNQLVPINRNGKLEDVFWTYGYSPVRDKDGKVQGTLVVCSETTEQILSERRLRALLGIAANSSSSDQQSQPESLISFAREIMKNLAEDSADLPFALMYLMTAGQILQAETNAAAGLSDARRWPLAEVAKSQKPLLLNDIQARFGELIISPWPEAVSSAYVLPLAAASDFPVQAVLVFGISPRLPFDRNYETFFQLLGARIAGLLQNQVHKVEIAQSARRFSRLAEANPFGTVIGSLRGTLNYVNPEFLKTLGYSAEDVAAGRVRWDSLTPPEYAAADARAVEQLREQGRCDVYEKVYMAKDGRRVPILIGAAAIDPTVDEPEIAAFVTDLTNLKVAQEALKAANEELERRVAERTGALEFEIQDRRRAEKSLQELTGRLLLAQDEERRHMARELHDHAGQTLVALGLNFAALLEEAKDQNPVITDLVAQSQRLSEDLSKEIRTLSYLLHPPLLDEAGLKSALQWFVEGFSKRSGILVDLELPEDSSRISRTIEIVVFRIIQESLTNVHRHSGSASAKIRLTRSPESIKVEITDQGKGIPQDKQKQMSAARLGVGVRGMEERVRQFGGTFQFRSTSRGTEVSATIPLTAAGATPEVK